MWQPSVSSDETKEVDETSREDALTAKKNTNSHDTWLSHEYFISF